MAPTSRAAPDRLTGERPQPGRTPDSLLALHDAGYRAVAERIGRGRVLDVGCGQGFETARLAGPGRLVVGVDRSPAATAAATTHRPAVAVARADAEDLGLADGAFDWVCSSHLVEHFADPQRHVAEMARVLDDDGTAFVLTPNAPADFENPFHVHPFVPETLEALLARYFAEVVVAGLEASTRVKEDFARRRARARRLLALDVLGLRRRMPRRWYVAAYGRLLPLAYRLLAPGSAGGASGFGPEDWFVADRVDETTPVLLATCRRPRRGRGAGVTVGAGGAG
jgi:SAM-dependent methyltransferase